MKETTRTNRLAEAFKEVATSFEIKCLYIVSGLRILLLIVDSFISNKLNNDNVLEVISIALAVALAIGLLTIATFKQKGIEEQNGNKT